MENLWVIFALISAFTLATSDALTKKALLLHNEYLIAWLKLLLSLPLLLSFLFFVQIPTLNINFFIAYSVALPLELVAIIFYTKALKVSPLSLTIPFLSLTPVFLIIIPYILIGERISFVGAIGTLFIGAGGYMLNLKKLKKGVFEPFVAIKKEKGSIFMIIVAFIFSFTASLGKMAIEHSSPIFFAVTYITTLTALFTPIALYKGKDEIKLILQNGALKASILPGIFQALMIISYMIAVSLTKVAYAISVKRFSLLIGIFYGYLFFNESGIKERLLGGVLMFIGFLLILLYH